MKLLHIWILWLTATMLTWCGLFWWSWDDGALACIDDTCFTIELATTSEERATWLMNRAELWTWSGMLFVFDNLWIHEFWMKDTLIPLDMIWMDEQGEVLYVKEFAPPCTNDPCQKFGPEEGVQSKYVLELNANQARLCLILYRYMVN